MKWETGTFLGVSSEDFSGVQIYRHTVIHYIIIIIITIIIISAICGSFLFQKERTSVGKKFRIGPLFVTYTGDVICHANDNSRHNNYNYYYFSYYLFMRVTTQCQLSLPNHIDSAFCNQGTKNTQKRVQERLKPKFSCIKDYIRYRA